MPLYLVPTPLGNLRDITLRSLDILKSANLIVAEDTRVTHRLLSAHGISGIQLLTFHAHSSPATIEAIVLRAQTEQVVFVSDAGMPGISDPGSELVRAAREALVPVEVLPGACAFIGSAVLSGFTIVGVSFEGFVPRTQGARRAAFAQALQRGTSSSWYESPHRIIATLTTLHELAPDIQIFVLREYTKMFEQQILGKPQAVLLALEQPVRGEITLVLDGSSYGTPDPQATATPEELDASIEQLAEDGLSSAAIAKRLASEGWGERSTLYRRIAQRGKADCEGPTTS